MTRNETSPAPRSVDAGIEDIEELVASWEELAFKYDYGHNSAYDRRVLDCAARLGADPGGPLAYVWVFGMVVAGRYLNWLPGDGVKEAALRALRTAEAALSARGRRLPHTTARHQLRWLTTKASKHGFTIPPAGGPNDIGPDGEVPLQLQRCHRGKNTFGKHDHQDKPIRVALTTATYEGALDVTNPQALRTFLTTGIGQGRAYGCGLLTLAPLEK